MFAIDFHQIEAGDVSCYECLARPSKAVFQGGECFSPDKTTKQKTQCDYCTFKQYNRTDVWVERNCQNFRESEEDHEDKCEPDRRGGCACKGNLCNGIKVDSKTIDCYLCKGTYSSSKPSDPCFTMDPKPAVQKDCAQCTIETVNEKSGETTITRECAAGAIEEKGWQVDGIINTYYCHDESSCNDLVIDPTAKITTIATSAKTTKETTALETTTPKATTVLATTTKENGGSGNDGSGGSGSSEFAQKHVLGVVTSALFMVILINLCLVHTQ